MAQRNILTPILALALITALVAIPLLAQERSSFGVVRVSDPQGQALIEYKESHALLIGVSDYTAGS